MNDGVGGVDGVDEFSSPCVRREPEYGVGLLKLWSGNHVFGELDWPRDRVLKKRAGESIGRSTDIQDIYVCVDASLCVCLCICTACRGRERT